MKQRVKKSPDIRRKEIMNGAQKLFLKEGYSQITVNDILNSVNLSKGGFYHYFDSKEAVLIALINEMTDEIIDELRLLLNDPNLTALNKLQLAFNEQQRLKRPKVGLIWQFITGIEDDTIKYTIIRHIWKRYVPLLAEIIQQGVTEKTMYAPYSYGSADLILLIISSLNRPEEGYEKDIQKLKRAITVVEDSINSILAISVENRVKFVNDDFIELIESFINKNAKKYQGGR